MPITYHLLFQDKTSEKKDGEKLSENIVFKVPTDTDVRHHKFFIQVGRQYRTSQFFLTKVPVSQDTLPEKIKGLSIFESTTLSTKERKLFDDQVESFSFKEEPKEALREANQQIVLLKAKIMALEEELSKKSPQ